VGHAEPQAGVGRRLTSSATQRPWFSPHRPSCGRRHTGILDQFGQVTLELVAGNKQFTAEPNRAQITTVDHLPRRGPAHPEDLRRLVQGKESFRWFGRFGGRGRLREPREDPSTLPGARRGASTDIAEVPRDRHRRDLNTRSRSSRFRGGVRVDMEVVVGIPRWGFAANHRE
jgi:hypothetical protein